GGGGLHLGRGRPARDRKRGRGRGDGGPRALRASRDRGLHASGPTEGTEIRGIAGANPPYASPALKAHVAGLDFHNPLLLAAGTAAYGRELAEVMVLDRLGGLVTKAVSVEPRDGAPAPRVTEFDGGVINAVGLANPGVDE